MELGTHLLFSTEFDKEYDGYAADAPRQTEFLRKRVLDIMDEQYIEEAKWLS